MRWLTAALVLVCPWGTAGAQSAALNPEATAERLRPVFLELNVGGRFLPVSQNTYFGLLLNHAQTAPEDEGRQFIGLLDLGLVVHVPLYHWLEVGGGARVLWGDWDAGPWTQTAFDAVGVEFTGHARLNVWFMDHWATRLPGQWGMDGGIFVELGLGLQVPVVLLRDTADADALFLLRPMAGMIFRMTRDLHWFLGGGYAAAFAHDGWDGNPGPSLSGSFVVLGLGLNLR